MQLSIRVSKEFLPKMANENPFLINGNRLWEIMKLIYIWL